MEAIKKILHDKSKLTSNQCKVLQRKQIARDIFQIVQNSTSKEEATFQIENKISELLEIFRPSEKVTMKEHVDIKKENKVFKKTFRLINEKNQELTNEINKVYQQNEKIKYENKNLLHRNNDMENILRESAHKQSIADVVDRNQSQVQDNCFDYNLRDRDLFKDGDGSNNMC